MENASKALLIAAEVLFGIMLLTMFTVLMSVFGNLQENYSEKKESQDIQAFNANFYNYERDNLTAQDIVTIYNFVKQYNESIDNNSTQKVNMTGSITIEGGNTYNFSNDKVKTNLFLEEGSYDDTGNYCKYKMEIKEVSSTTGKVKKITVGNT